MSLNLTATNLTHAVAAAVALLGWASQDKIWGELLQEMGLFALSGSLTNGIAIHMLFERVPGFWGSGVIELRFAAIRRELSQLILDEFFTRDRLRDFLGQHSETWVAELARAAAQLDLIDSDAVFDRLVRTLEASPLGTLLAMMGGVAATERIRGPVTAMLRDVVRESLTQPQLQAQAAAALRRPETADRVREQAQALVAARLEKLTPQATKQLVQQMIAAHLDWLVVWGGVLGALLGALAWFLRA